MVRRPWGTGAVYRRKSDGRWIGRLSDGHGGHRYVTSADKETVKRRLRELSVSTTGRRRGSTETVSAYLARWLDDTAAHRVRPRTLHSYRAIVRDHIEPAIGSVKLRDLEPPAVQRMLSGVHRSPQTKRNVLAVLRVALSQAVRWGLVTVNAAKMVEQPRVPRRERVTLTLDEVRVLLAGTSGEPLHALYVLAVTTGMRSGELRALRWRDLRGDTLAVTGTLREVEPHVYAREEPKTPRSRRTLPLSRAAVGALEAHRAAHAHSPQWVFAHANGEPWTAAGLVRTFQADLRRLGLRRVTLHSLRHTAAALMLEGSGGDLRMVMATLGHANVATTVDLYGGMAAESRQRAAKVMDDVFDGRGTERNQYQKPL